MGYAARAGITLLLAVVVLKESVGAEEALTSYELNLLYVAFGAAALAVYAWREWPPSLGGGRPSLPQLAGAAVATVLLVAVLSRVDGPGIAEEGRSLTFLGIYLLVLAYPLLHHDVRRLLRRNWPYLLSFAVLWGVYLYHGSTHGTGSGLAAFPIAVGFLLAVNLFVVPRYVSVDDFTWALARISAVVVLLGLVAYLVGEYTVVGVTVQLWDTTFSPPLLAAEMRPLQSIFENPNTTGILAFVGTLAALVELHRGYDRLTADASDGTQLRRESQGTRTALAVTVPAVLLLVNGVGLYLTHSRASMLAAGAGGIVYFAYASFGRAALPSAILGVGALVVVALGAIAANLVDVDPGGRFVLWSAGVEALLRAPSLLGEGIVETGGVIEPYVSDPGHRGSGVHNSYLTTAIRAGLLGGAAHLVLAVGSVVHAALADRRVDAGAIALAVGFAVHQLFESYTLFQHSMGAVLAALVVGFVVVRVPAARASEVESRSIADVFGRSDARSLPD